MSGELRAPTSSGLTVYAHILNSSGQIWNGSIFETYTSANWSSYTVATTEQGASGLYVGNFPTAIATLGQYDIFFYQQVGGSKAEGDPLVGTNALSWTGTTISNVVTATLSGIVQEALSKAGYSSPSSTLTARAQGNWMAEIKGDVWKKSKTLKSLQMKAVVPLTVGLGQYSNPSDFSSDLQMEFVTGARYGTAQAGSSSTITLSSSESAQATDLQGREIALVTGTGLAQIAYIINYVPSTKVATVSPSWSTTPDSTTGYVILDDYRPMEPLSVEKMGYLSNPTQQDYPQKFYPIGDSSTGKFILAPVPFRNDAQPMIIIQRYYANLLLLDLSGALVALLYQNWRDLWDKGIYWKALLDANDDGATSAEKEYRQEVKETVRLESYFNTLPMPQATVTDY